MGLFSKPTEDKVLNDFNSLSAEQQEIVRQKLLVTKEEHNEVVEPQPEVVENVTDAQPTETEKVDDGEAKKTESFEELFRKLQEENNKKFEELQNSFNEKLESLRPKDTEKQPFGLSEGSKEYKATYKEKETSDDMLKKIFGK